MLLRIVFLLLITNKIISFAQNLVLENWRSYTSLVNVLSADYDEDNQIWCATNGGVFYYSPSTNQFNFFNNTNGLYSSESKLIKFNPFTKEIYLGTLNGVLSIFNGSKWINFLDIKNSSFPNSEITNFYFTDSIVYIVGGFGITTFDPWKKIFLKTPSRLGNIPSGTIAYDCLIYHDTLWVATNLGLAKISIHKNIANPQNWQNISQIEGTINPKIKFLISFNDSLFVFSDTVAYLLEEGKFKRILTLESYDVINCVQVHNGKILYSTPFIIRDIYWNVYFYYLYSQNQKKINGFKSSNGNELTIFLENNGLLFFNPLSNQKTHFLPNSPSSNFFTFLVVDEMGAIWSATESDPRGQGIMRYYQGNWTNFNTSLFPQIRSNHFFKLTSIGNKIYASNFGSGILEITTYSDSFEFKTFDHTNSPLTGIIQDSKYVVVQQTQYDIKDSLLWIVNYSNGQPGYLLIAKDNNDNFYPFLYSTERSYHHLVIDLYGTKWIASNDGKGLIYFNENGTLSDTTDDITGDLKRSISLPSNVILTLSVDQFGYIWCGTSQGIFIIVNPDAILKGNLPVVRKLKVLEDQPIFTIYVDPLNNKWIGTSEGIYVLAFDGFEILASFNQNNSPLITNEILSITSNPSSGVFYFGSRHGLVSATSLIIKPSSSFDIRVYPSPFYPKKDKFLVIDGLAGESEVKILTTNGDFVQSIFTSSRKLLWDGKNYRGEFVTSGIYLIAAKSYINSQTAIYKVAIINE